MRSDRAWGCFIPSAASIGVGGVTTILWLILTYMIVCQNIHPLHTQYTQSEEYKLLHTATIAVLITTFSCAAMSVLMMVGVANNIAGYMFPWLAVHFVIMVTGISLMTAIVFVVIFTDGIQMFYYSILGGILISGTMVFVWSIVYLHYKNLYAGVRPISDNKGKVLKLPNESEKPYRPV